MNLRLALPALLASLALYACSAAPPAPSSAPPSSAATPGPGSAASAPPPAVDPSCEAACAYIESCKVPRQPSCRPSCAADIAPRSRGAAYLACVKALSCADIEVSMQMNEGPLGRCATEAHRR